MIHPDDALRLIESIECRLGSETVALASALGRIPAEELRARVDQPPFDKATMDGFAYAGAEGSMAESGASFEVVDAVAAGAPPPSPLSAGECVRIMTGAPVPVGACAVHRLERAEFAGSRMVVASREDEINIIRRGANRRAGDPLISRRPLKPQDLALLASDGIAEIRVVARPRVAVLSTGCELRSPGEELAPGAIYDSNGRLLVALAEASGCSAVFSGVVPDDEGALREAVRAASAGADLLLVSGGVSAGDFDFVPSALESSGFDLLFHGVAVRPGKPVLLARRGGLFVFGLPGNPVSAFVDFELFAKCLIRRFAGLIHEPKLVRVRLGAPVSREVADRVEFRPLELRGGLAHPLRYTGSTMLDVLPRTDALARLEIGQREMPKGAEILARFL
jgi:molybdopterin molybdotransferase